MLSLHIVVPHKKWFPLVYINGCIQFISFSVFLKNHNIAMCPYSFASEIGAIHYAQMKPKSNILHANV